MDKNINSLLRRSLATFLIFNHLFVFCPQAGAIPEADVRHIHDLFGEEITSHIVRKARDVNVTREVRETIPLGAGASQDVDVRQDSNGAYSLRFDSSQEQEVIHFHDSGKSVGTWIRSQEHGIFIGSTEEKPDIDIQSPLTLSSLKVVVGGCLRFLQAVTLKEKADIESRSLSVLGHFSSQGVSKFAVQEKMEVLQGGRLASEEGIFGKVKSFFNRGSVTTKGDIFLEGEDLSNNGLIEGARSLVLRGITLINRAHLKAKTMLMDIRKALSNIGGSSIEATDEFKATYSTFDNTGSIKVEKDFSSKGEKFENKRSSSSRGNLEVGGLYQAHVHTYIDSGTSTWNGLALIHTQIADLAGHYTCASTSMTAEKSIVARGGSNFQASHFLELKSENGTLDFGGDLFLSPTVKKPVFSQGSPLALLVSKMPHLISMDGCKKLTQRGNVLSTSSAVSYSSEGKFDFTGRSRSGEATLINAQHARLDGILQASGDIILSLKENLSIAGEIAGRNLRAMVQNLFVSGSIKTDENAVLKVDRSAEVASTGSLQIGETLALTSDGDVTLAGTVHAKQSVVQANTITNTGSFSVDEFAHFKADTLFANLWEGRVEAKDIQIDAALSLNLLSKLSATRSLTTNSLVDLNLLGLKTAHHITSNTLFSLDAGLSLPSLHPSDLLSWESAMKGLKAAALSFAPAEVRSVINLGFAAYNVCQQASKLYEKYSSLDDKVRFSDLIPLLVGIKDLGFSTYTIAKNAGALVSKAQEAFEKAVDVFKAKEVVSTMLSCGETFLQNVPRAAGDAAGAAASVFMPSVTQDSLIGINAGLMASGHVYQRGIKSINTGGVGTSTYTNDAQYADNEGLVAARQIHYANTHFHNGGALIGGDVRAAATESATNTGRIAAIGGNSSAILEGKIASNSGTVSTVGENSHAAVVGTDHVKNMGSVTSKGDESSAIVRGEVAESSASVISSGVNSYAAVVGTNHAKSAGVVVSTGDGSSAVVQGEVAENSGSVTSSGANSKAAVIGDHANNSGAVSSTGVGSSAVVQGRVAESLGSVRSAGVNSHAAVAGKEHAKNSGDVSSTGDGSSAVVQGRVAGNSGAVSSEGANSCAAVIGVGLAKNSGDVDAKGDGSSAAVQGEAAENSGSVTSSGTNSRAAVVGTNCAESTDVVASTGNGSRATIFGANKTSLGMESVTSAQYVSIGQKVVETADQDGKKSLSVVRSKKTQITQGASIAGTEAHIAGNTLHAAAAIKTTTASLDSVKLHVTSTLHASGDLHLRFTKGYIGNATRDEGKDKGKNEGSRDAASVTSDGKVSIHVNKGGSLTLTSGYTTREYTDTQGNTTTSVREMVVNPSQIHGEKGLTIHIGENGLLRNVGSKLSASRQAELRITGEAGARQEHLAAYGKRETKVHTTASLWNRFWGADAGHSTTQETTGRPELSAGQCTSFGFDKTTFQAADIRAQQPPSLETKDMHFLAATGSIERKDYKKQPGWVCSDAEENTSKDGILEYVRIRDFNGNDLGSNIQCERGDVELEDGKSLDVLPQGFAELSQEGKVTVQRLSAEHWSETSHNRSLTPAAKLGISVALIIATNGAGASLLGAAGITAPTFVVAGADALVTGILMQTATGEINLALRDKHWAEAFSIRDLALNVALAGGIAKIVPVLIPVVKKSSTSLIGMANRHFPVVSRTLLAGYDKTLYLLVKAKNSYKSALEGMEKRFLEFGSKATNLGEDFFVIRGRVALTTTEKGNATAGVWTRDITRGFSAMAKKPEMEAAKTFATAAPKTEAQVAKSYTAAEKTKTQVSNALPDKIAKKRPKVVDSTQAASNKSAMQGARGSASGGLSNDSIKAQIAKDACEHTSERPLMFKGKYVTGEKKVAAVLEILKDPQIREKQLSGGRIIYCHPKSNTIIIQNRVAPDKSTVFQRTNAVKYFHDQEAELEMFKYWESLDAVE